MNASPPSANDDGPVSPRAWQVWAPLAVGAILRCGGLGHQILGGDEPHPLRAALSSPLGKILTTYQAPDTYLPFAGLCRLVLAAGGALDERWLRLPGLVTGLVLVWLLPRLVRPWVGHRAAYLTAWVLALAPPLVLYSRIVRAYAPLMLIVVAAALAFFRWLERPTVGRAALYVGLATLAVVFHPVAGPGAGAPLAFGCALAAVNGGFRRERWRGLAGLAIALPLAIGVALLPARASLAALVSARRVEAHYDWETLRGLLFFDAGAKYAAVAVVVWALTAWGWSRLLQRQPRFAVFLLWMFLAQIAGVVVLSPVGVGEPLLFNRYVIVGLPFALIWLGVGLADLGERAGMRDRRAGVVLVAALLVAWVGLGPFGEAARWNGSFAHHNDFVTFQCPRATLADADVPTPYRAIAAAPGEGSVVEYPWSSVWRFGRALYAYQDLHRRSVMVGSTEGLAADPRVHLRRVIAGTPAAFRASGARFVVVHLDPRGEERRLQVAACGEPTAESWRVPAWDTMAARGRQMASTLETQWGSPTWADASVEVWDLAVLGR